jgi:tetratricopeptide (TPR) repeat protein
MKLCDQALREKGETSWVWQARGEVLLARGQPHEDFCFAKAITLAPKDWFERVVIARIHMLYRMAAVALKWLREALSLCASSAWLWAQIGMCQQSLGLSAEARAAYTNALAIDLDCPGARAALMALDSEHAGTALWRKITRFLRGDQHRGR